MLDTRLQPVTILYKGPQRAQGVLLRGKRPPSSALLASWPSTPRYTACQDEMLTPSAGETPAPRNKRLNLLHKLGHRSGMGRGEAQGMLNSLFLTLLGPCLSSGIPSPRRTSFWEDPGQITSLGEGPGFLPCWCPRDSQFKAVWWRKAQMESPAGQPAPACFPSSQCKGLTDPTCPRSAARGPLIQNRFSRTQRLLA